MRTATLTKEVKPGLPVDGNRWDKGRKKNLPPRAFLAGIVGTLISGPSLSSGRSGEKGISRRHTEKGTVDHAANFELYAVSGMETRKDITRYLQDK